MVDERETAVGDHRGRDPCAAGGVRERLQQAWEVVGGGQTAPDKEDSLARVGVFRDRTGRIGSATHRQNAGGEYGESSSNRAERGARGLRVDHRGHWAAREGDY